MSNTTKPYFYIDEQGRSRFRHDENYQLLYYFMEEQRQSSDGLRPGKGSIRGLVPWEMLDSWSMDVACQAIVFGTDYDLDHEIDFHMKEGEAFTAFFDIGDVTWKVRHRFLEFAKSAFATGKLKDPDTPINWINWAKEKGYSVDHLKIKEPTSTSMGATIKGGDGGITGNGGNVEIKGGDGGGVMVESASTKPVEGADTSQEEPPAQAESAIPPEPQEIAIDAPADSPAGNTIAGAKKCKGWLVQLMSDSMKDVKMQKPTKTKIEYQTEARDKFPISIRAFNREWEAAIRETGATQWSSPGRPSRKS